MDADHPELDQSWDTAIRSESEAERWIDGAGPEPEGGSVRNWLRHYVPEYQSAH